MTLVAGNIQVQSGGYPPGSSRVNKQLRIATTAMDYVHDTVQEMTWRCCSGLSQRAGSLIDTKVSEKYTISSLKKKIVCFSGTLV
jgi:hypothetical protein